MDACRAGFAPVRSRRDFACAIAGAKRPVEIKVLILVEAPGQVDVGQREPKREITEPAILE